MNISTNQTFNNSSTVFHKISLIIVFLLAVASVFSPLRAIPDFNLLWASCIFAWYVLTALDKPIFLLKFNIYNYVLYFFVLYTIITPYLFGNDRIGNRFFEISQVFLFYLAYKKNKYINRNIDNVWIVKWLIPFLVITSVKTVYAYQFDPDISRTIKRGSEVARENLLNGIGGYELVYFLVLVTPLIVMLLINWHHVLGKLNSLMLLILIIIFSVNIVLSNYAIALLLFIFGVIIIIAIKKISFTRIFLITLFVIIILIFGNNLTGSIFDLIGNELGDTRNAVRMSELSQFTSSNIMGKSVEARWITYNESVKVFFKNPIFGNIIEDLNFKTGVRGFGQHSQILDCFALFGFLIGFIQLYLFTKPFTSRLHSENLMLKKISFTVLILFIALVFTNNITPSIGFAVFFIFPTFYDWYSENLETQFLKL